MGGQEAWSLNCSSPLKSRPASACIPPRFFRFAVTFKHTMTASVPVTEMVCGQRIESLDSTT